MKEMQFAAMVLMTMLTVTLTMVLKRDSGRHDVANRSRWLLAAGTALLALQFLLQYALGFRQMGVTQAVMVNLLFFVPAAWLISVAVLNLQYEGRLKRHHWLPGAIVWGVTAGLLFIANLTDHKPIMTDTPELRLAEYASGIAFTFMQIHYSVCMFRGNRRLHNTLNNYYDHDTSHLLLWMERSIVMLLIIGLGVPFLIFSSGIWLAGYALLIFFSIFYLVVSFICYFVSNDSTNVTAAQQNAQKAGLANEEKLPGNLTDEELQRVGNAVEKWLATEAYLKSGLTMPAAAAEIQVSQRNLRAWYQAKGYESYSEWMQQLRIEYAKALMTEHPDWGFETIAKRSGFSSRPYFHKVFQNFTGTTPQQFVSTISPA